MGNCEYCVERGKHTEGTTVRPHPNNGLPLPLCGPCAELYDLRWRQRHQDDEQSPLPASDPVRGLLDKRDTDDVMRFDLEGDVYGPTIQPIENGQYVRYEDYEQLVTKLDAFRKLYDDTPRHKDAPDAYDFISLHNRMILEHRNEIKRLQSRLDSVKAQLEWGRPFDGHSELFRRIEDALKEPWQASASPDTHEDVALDERVERDVEKPCPTCGGDGEGQTDGSYSDIPLCQTCKGSGRVSDRHGR